MTMSGATKTGTTKPDAAQPAVYAVFAVTFGVVFSIAYLFVMDKSWQLFTYYPAVGQWTLFGHPATGPSPGPGMKWFGYVATCAIVAAVAGAVVSFIPEKLLTRVWWSGLVWLVPIVSMIVVGYLIVVVGD